MANRYSERLLAVSEDVGLWNVAAIVCSGNAGLRENFFHFAFQHKPYARIAQGNLQIVENQRYRLLLCAFLATLSNREIDEMKKEWEQS